MSATTVLFLPPDDDETWRWLRVADDAVTARGEGLPALDEGDVVAVAPADAVSLHWADLPARSTAQAVAAARILVTDASAVGPGELHVAVGRDAVDERPIGVVSALRMRAWLDRLALDGIDPAAVVPAPLLLPRPDEGFVRADLGGQTVVRGPTSGFADEAPLTGLVTGGVTPAALDREGLEQAIAAAVAAPALDLRQGPFARRRRIGLDWKLIARLGVLVGLILLATLAIDLVRIAKYSFGADMMEAQADTVARQALPRGQTAGDADRLLAERLSRVRGPGLGFSRTAAAVFVAVRSVPGSELTALNFEPNGDLRVSVATQGEVAANDLKVRIEQAGYSVTASTFQSTGGRLTGELTVTAP